MGDNMGDNLVMGLDLNQEPLVDPPSPSPSPLPPAPEASQVIGSFLEALETERVGIEDRLRQLEAVTARTSHRRRWRRSMNMPDLSYIPVTEPVVEAPANGGERGTNRKRDITQLAKALEIDLDPKKTAHNGAVNGDDDDKGCFFDCNICLDVARDPILTCCGHLFCWGCFYQVSYVNSIAKECPVCKGEVIDSNITPIYGNGKNSPVSDLDSGVKIPPRPPALRVESLRQQRFSRRISNIPVADALRRISISLGLNEQNPPQSVTSETDASLSSISSALTSAERFVEDLEAYISGRRIRRNAQIWPEFQERDIPATGEMNGTDASFSIDLTASHWRRSSNLDGEAALELWRSRLR